MTCDIGCLYAELLNENAKAWENFVMANGIKLYELILKSYQVKCGETGPDPIGKRSCVV